MNQLVFLQNEQALTTSFKVANHFGKRHDNVIRDIQNIGKEIDSLKFEEMFRKSSYPDDYGRQQPMYQMNRDGFTLLAMGFTGKKALQFKLDYIQAFNAMERKIIELIAERKSEEWRAIRQAGKRGNKKMCAAINEVIIPLARAEGSTTSDTRFYQTYQKLVNKTACVNPNSRDELSLGQLYEVEKIQSIANISIRGLAARGEGYKQIYRNTKQTLENYSRLSLVPERFLLS